MVVIASPALRTRETNPYQALLYEAMERVGAEVQEYAPGLFQVGQCDILHFHWPEVQMIDTGAGVTLVKAARFLLILALARARDARVVWTAHNLRSHAQMHPRLEAVCWRLFYRLLDGIIFLSEASREELLQRCPKLRQLPLVVIPHGHYRDAYPARIATVEARRHLGLAPLRTVFAWVGQIRRYKGLEDLVAAWHAWPVADASLLIAGKLMDEVLQKPLADAAVQDSRIFYRPGWLDVEKMRDVISAADVLVLPYRAVTNSGSALLALSLDVPVALPRSAAMEELQTLVGADWIFLYQGPISAHVLDEIRAWLRETQRSSRAPLDPLNWDRLARTTFAFFKEFTGVTKTVSA